MRKVISLLFALLLISSTAYAGGEKSCDSYFWGKVANECSPHTVDTDTDTQREKDDFSAGAGLDFFLWKAEKFNIESQTKYDSVNENGSSYIVVKVKSEKGLIQNILSLFKKGE